MRNNESLKYIDTSAKVLLMGKIDPVWLSVMSDWFINFSVFWLGVAIVSPIFPGIDQSFKMSILTSDIAASIISLYIAYMLRRVVI